jgi:hypothetical protein
MDHTDNIALLTADYGEGWTFAYVLDGFDIEDNLYVYENDIEGLTAYVPADGAPIEVE